ncbi:MAG TPA: penicillin-binding transpeptidase domain-containing protein, partial [Patescibacteria group bacterium]|nr:penicillin-binding transpeptidase domain-containing protein [Patescibacteria group bacterium]
VYNEDWYLSETFDAAIGQGFQLTTPLQMAMVYSQIANGGHRYQPYLVSRITNSNGDVLQTFQPKEVGQTPLSAQNMKLIQDSLRDVALEGGTAAYEFRDFPIPVSGKTGTAENSHGKDHGWFVAYAPYEDPRIVVVVIVEQGGFGATASAPIAKHILEAAFNINQDAAVAGPRIVRPGTAL